MNFNQANHLSYASSQWHLFNLDGSVKRNQSLPNRSEWLSPEQYIGSLDTRIKSEVGAHIRNIANATAKVVHGTTPVANAILIAPDMILSSAHCFPYGSGLVIFNNTVPVMAKLFLSTTLTNELGCDFAILKLDQPVNIRPAQLSLTNNPEQSIFLTHQKNGSLSLREYQGLNTETHRYMPRYHHYNFQTKPGFSGGPSIDISTGKTHCIHQGQNRGLRIVDIYAELDYLTRTHPNALTIEKAHRVMSKLSIDSINILTWPQNTTTYPIQMNEVSPEIGSNMVAKGAVLNQSEYGFYPMGFKDFSEFRGFFRELRTKLTGKAKEAFKNQDFTIVFHGSSVTGESYKDKGTGSRDFDVERTSDYDITLVSYDLFEQAKSFGAKVRGRDNHTEPLTAVLIDQLGLKQSQDDSVQYIQNTQNKKRDVNFMIYASLQDATKHEGGALQCAIYGRRLYTHPLGDLGGIHK